MYVCAFYVFFFVEILVCIYTHRQRWVVRVTFTLLHFLGTNTFRLYLTMGNFYSSSSTFLVKKNRTFTSLLWATLPLVTLS